MDQDQELMKKEMKETKTAIAALREIHEKTQGDLKAAREEVLRVGEELKKIKGTNRAQPALLCDGPEDWVGWDDEGEMSPYKRAVRSTRYLKRMEMGTERPDDERLAEFHQSHDALLMVARIMQSKMGDRNARLLVEDLKASCPKSLARYAAAVQGMRVGETMDTVTELASWMPVAYAGRMWEKVRLALKIANVFEVIPQPTASYDLPIEGTDLTAYLGGELTTEPEGGASAWTISKSTVGKVTLAAKKSVCRTVVSDEATEDTMLPVIPYVEKKQTLAHAYALEDAIINGQATGAIDSGVAAPDFKMAFNGLRKLAYSVKTAATLDMSTFDEAKLRTLWAMMGFYGGDVRNLVFATSLLGYFKFLGLANIWTVDKYGPNAVILNGELGKWCNIPILVSELYPVTMDATGVIPASPSTYTGLSMFRKDCFIRGMRHAFELKILQELYAASGGVGIVSYQRQSFADLFPAVTALDVVYGYKIS